MNRRSRGFLCAVLLSAVLPPLAQAACKPNIPLTRPDARYVDNNDGTVTDTVTKLMWKQCAEGLSGAGCATGSASDFTWAAALQQAQTVNSGGGFAGHTDWRLPNFKELKSLIEIACYMPAINMTFFPATPSGGYLSVFWSSSPVALHLGYAWSVSFDFGAESVDGDGSYRVRLVRAGR